jgi:hypothetical protein
MRTLIAEGLWSLRWVQKRPQSVQKPGEASKLEASLASLGPQKSRDKVKLLLSLKILVF